MGQLHGEGSQATTTGGTSSGLIEIAGAAGWAGVYHADSTGSADAATPASSSATTSNMVMAFILFTSSLGGFVFHQK
jgi:hypothetical protein